MGVSDEVAHTEGAVAASRCARLYATDFKHYNDA
jgi:hypothetical protein